MKNLPNSPIKFESISALPGVNFFLVCYYAATNHTKLHSLKFFPEVPVVLFENYAKKFSVVTDVGWNKKMLNI